MSEESPLRDPFDVPGDEWTSRLLDDRQAPEGEIGDWPADVDPHRAADLRWLHVLLEQVHGDDRAGNEARVQRVMAALERDAVQQALTGHKPQASGVAAPLRRRHRSTVRRWVYSLGCAAVAVLCFASARVWLNGFSQAEAAVERASAEAAAETDREYRVTTHLRNSDSQVQTIQSTLYTRGSKFALRHPGLVGELWIGSNGQRAWIMPAAGLPLLDQPHEAAHTWAQAERMPLLELQLSSFLLRCRQYYELESLAPAPLGPGSVLFTHVRGRLKSGGNGPPWLARELELFADAQSNVVRRMVLDWRTEETASGLVKLEVDYIAEQPRDDHWYEASGHPRRNLFAPPDRD